jgi:hypothetical protein
MKNEIATKALRHKGKQSLYIKNFRVFVSSWLKNMKEKVNEHRVS